MNTLRYVTVTFVLPDNRILLQRQRMSESSASQWRATVEYVLSADDAPRAVLNRRIMEDYGLNLAYGPSPTNRYIMTLLPVINLGHGARVITPFLVKILSMWRFKALHIFEFHAKPFEELLDDIYQNSVYRPGMVAGTEKHSLNTIQVISKIDQKGFKYV